MEHEKGKKMAVVLSLSKEEIGECANDILDVFVKHMETKKDEGNVTQEDFYKHYSTFLLALGFAEAKIIKGGIEVYHMEKTHMIKQLEYNRKEIYKEFGISVDSYGDKKD